MTDPHPTVDVSDDTEAIDDVNTFESRLYQLIAAGERGALTRKEMCRILHRVECEVYDCDTSSERNYD